MIPLSLRRRIRALSETESVEDIARELGLSRPTVKAVLAGRDDEHVPEALYPGSIDVYRYIRDNGPTSPTTVCQALGYRFEAARQAKATIGYLAVCRVVVRDGYQYAVTDKTWDDVTVLDALDGPRTVPEISEALGMEPGKVWKALAELESIGAVWSGDGVRWGCRA